jgi:hypothetical protein
VNFEKLYMQCNVENISILNKIKDLTKSNKINNTLTKRKMMLVNVV